MIYQFAYIYVPPNVEMHMYFMPIFISELKPTCMGFVWHDVQYVSRN